MSVLLPGHTHHMRHTRLSKPATPAAVVELLILPVWCPACGVGHSPDPDCPTKATVCPASILRLKPSGWSGPPSTHCCGLQATTPYPGGQTGWLAGRRADGPRLDHDCWLSDLAGYRKWMFLNSSAPLTDDSFLPVGASESIDRS